MADSGNDRVRTNVRAIAIASVFVLVLAWVWLSGGSGGTRSADSQPEVTTYQPTLAKRLSGDSAVKTAIGLSREGWSQAGAVVLVPEESLAAASIAAPLAASLQAPVLLCAQGVVPEETAAEVARLGARTIYLVGREDLLPTKSRVVLPGVQVVRVTGVDDVAASGAVARLIAESGSPNEVFVVPSEEASQVGLSTAMLAADRRAPLLLSDQKGALPLGKSDAALSQVEFAFVVQGDVPLDASGLASSVISTMAAQPAAPFAAALGERGFALGTEYTQVFVVREVDFQHAMAAPALNVRQGTRSPLLVAEERALGAPCDEFLRRHASSIESVRFIGPGGSGAGRVERAAVTAAETKLYKDAVPVSNDAAKSISQVTSDVIVFTGTAPDIKKGQVLVGTVSEAAPEGFIRRVKQVRTEGGKTVVDVELAGLEDVIYKGSFDIRQVPEVVDPPEVTNADERPGEPRLIPASWTHRPEPLRSDAGTVLTPVKTKTKRAELFDYSPPLKELTAKKKLGNANLSLSIEPEQRFSVAVIVRYSRDFGRLESFELVTEMTHVSTIKAKAEVAYGREKETKPVTLIPIGPEPLEQRLAMATTVVPIGPFMIPVTSTSYFYASASWKIMGGVESVLKNTNVYEVGFRWAREDEPKGSMVFRKLKSTHSEELRVYAGFNAHLFVGLKQDLKVAGIIGPYIRAGAYGDLEVRATKVAVGSTPGETNAEAKVEGGIEAIAGGELGIPGIKTISVEATPLKVPMFSKTWQLAYYKPKPVTPPGEGANGLPPLVGMSGADLVLYNPATREKQVLVPGVGHGGNLFTGNEKGWFGIGPEDRHDDGEYRGITLFNVKTKRVWNLPKQTGLDPNKSDFWLMWPISWDNDTFVYGATDVGGGDGDTYYMIDLKTGKVERATQVQGAQGSRMFFEDPVTWTGPLLVPSPPVEGYDTHEFWHYGQIDVAPDKRWAVGSLRPDFPAAEVEVRPVYLFAKNGKYQRLPLQRPVVFADTLGLN